MSARPALLVGIDIGSSGVKGVLCATDGEVLASRRIAIQVERPHPGWAEHDAELDWWAPTQLILRELTGHADKQGSAIAAVGVSGLCPVVVPVDHRGEPLRPAILYSIDRRATAELAEIAALYDPREILRRSGPRPWIEQRPCQADVAATP